MSDRGGSDISPDPAPEAAAALDAFRSQLLLRGMDLVHSMSTGSYNRALAEMASAEGPESAIASLHPLPSYGRPVRSDSDSDSGCLALILGNSRSLWRPFLRWLRADGARLDGLPNPLEGPGDCWQATCNVGAWTKPGVQKQHHSVNKTLLHTI